MRTAVPTTRPKKPAINARIQIRVPKMTRDDMHEPDAEIHRYVGADSPFKSSTVINETPRMFIVEMDGKEADDFKSAYEQECKDRLPNAKRSKGLAMDLTIVNPGNSQQALAQMMTPNQVQGDDEHDG